MSDKEALKQPVKVKKKKISKQKRASSDDGWASARSSSDTFQRSGERAKAAAEANLLDRNDRIDRQTVRERRRTRLAAQLGGDEESADLATVRRLEKFGSAAEDASPRPLYAMAALVLVFAVAEFVGGILTSSLALVRFFARCHISGFLLSFSVLLFVSCSRPVCLTTHFFVSIFIIL